MRLNTTRADGNKRNNLLFPFLRTPRRRHLESALLKGQSLGLLLLSIDNFFAFRKIYGEEIACHVLEVIKQAIGDVAKEILSDCDLLFIEKLESGNFAILFHTQAFDPCLMPDLAMSLRLFTAFDDELRHYADKRIRRDLDDGMKVNYGKFGKLLAEVKAVTGETA